MVYIYVMPEREIKGKGGKMKKLIKVILTGLIIALIAGCGKSNSSTPKGGTPDISFGTNGVVFTNNPGGGHSAVGISIITDSQNRILVTGWVMDNSGNQSMTIWRYNANGTPDTSFGTNGAVITNTSAGGHSAVGNSIITDTQGRILVAGYAEDGSGNCNMTIWRYNTNGTPDPTFGTNGVVFTNTAARGITAVGGPITIDTQSRILVTGWAEDSSGNGGMTIWRYNANGTPDTSFGTNGAVFTKSPGGGNFAQGSSIVMDTQGRILVAGSADNNSGHGCMTMWRYNANGTPDISFGTNGVVFTNNPAGIAWIEGSSIVTDRQGRILVAGSEYDGSRNQYLMIWRYTTAGGLDPTFGTNGVVITNTSAGGIWAQGYSIVTDTLGKILVTGWASDSSGHEYMTIWRYNPDGTPDTSFGMSGVLITNNSAGGIDANGCSITTDTQGRILVTGWIMDSSKNYYMTIWRFLP